MATSIRAGVLAREAGCSCERRVARRHGGRNPGGGRLALTSYVTQPAFAWLAAAVLVQLRLLANLLDGMVAIEAAQASRVGELFNEVPDRVSDAATLVGLGFAVGSVPLLGFLAAILAILVAYIRAASPRRWWSPRLLRADGQTTSDVRRDPGGCDRRRHSGRLAVASIIFGLGRARGRSGSDRGRLRDHGPAAARAGGTGPEGRSPMSQSRSYRLSAYFPHGTSKTWDRLFGFRHAFDEPFVVVIVSILGVALALAPLAILVLDRTGRLGPDLKEDLWRRYLSWLVMVPVVVLPVLLGAAWALLLFTVLSLLSFREFAAATGVFREKVMSLLVVIGILSLTFAVADHFYRLFVALTPMNIVVITAVATSQDRPKGYIQRVALAIFGFVLFGTCLGHLSYMTNDTHYRSLDLALDLLRAAQRCVRLHRGQVAGRAETGTTDQPEQDDLRRARGCRAHDPAGVLAERHRVP